MTSSGSRLHRPIWVSALFLLVVQTAFCQPAPKPLPLHHALQDKEFYLLSLLQNNPDVHEDLLADKGLSAIAAERQHDFEFVSSHCKDNVACTLKPFLWTDEEISAVGRALAREDQHSRALQHLVDAELRPSGAYILDDSESGADLLREAWQICARGLNDIIAVYGEGAAPRYPRIDSISFDVSSAEFQQRIASLAHQAADSGSTSELFFQPSLRLALSLLVINHRDEAGRLEPMETGANAAAVKAIPGIHWKQYPYSVIVVPGEGPSDPNVPLDPVGRTRTELAAQAWRAGKAPLILVSGGYVHPSQTRFSEALEMKKALLSDYHVPESAIIVDPHARHTTTNMRNAARLIYRYGIPMDKPGLVISDAAQIDYIASRSLAERCERELGYLPYRITEHPSPNSLVFLPAVDSLEQDPQDPLDP